MIRPFFAALIVFALVAPLLEFDEIGALKRRLLESHRYSFLRSENESASVDQY